MAWSVSLGRIAGTELRIHLTFFLLIAWFAGAAAIDGGAVAAADAAIFIVLVFSCVVAHEFGHAMMARAFGISTRDITLLPIGGVANIERLPTKPGQEILIAIAGPAINIVIAVALFVFLGANIDAEKLANVETSRDLDLVTRLAIINMALVAFNMLPAFPMDGGRVFRALLSFSMPRGRATRFATQVGQAIAFGLGFLGLFGNPILIFIALFVFLAGAHEAYAVELDEATQGVEMRHATITSFATLSIDATVREAVEKLLSTSQTEFPVIDAQDALKGVLTRDGLIKALAERGRDTPVAEVMETNVATLNRRAPLSEAVRILHESGQLLVGIVDDQERLVGLLTLENLAEYMMVSGAIGSSDWPMGRTKTAMLGPRSSP